ncbi:hypothetical protein GKZ89_19315 [Bacillus mangrovi]|uniref:Uncharacterized protein n=1 Tax=Metabacillus mangrovi TaxID=1491830 RepID=A0A7X2S8E0_9BACI|nr:hypothetical protein [Metabacillus mangrovi]MTH55547.1 hypothetical protein [Metabacillus mangrovi]
MKNFLSQSTIPILISVLLASSLVPGTVSAKEGPHRDHDYEGGGTSICKNGDTDVYDRQDLQNLANRYDVTIGTGQPLLDTLMSLAGPLGITYGVSISATQTAANEIKNIAEYSLENGTHLAVKSYANTSGSYPKVLIDYTLYDYDPCP